MSRVSKIKKRRFLVCVVWSGNSREPHAQFYSITSLTEDYACKDARDFFQIHFPENEIQGCYAQELDQTVQLVDQRRISLPGNLEKERL